MSDISKISPDNGTNEYNLKDVEARKRVSESLLDDTVGWVGKNINQTVYTTKAASAASGVDWTYTDNVLDANGTATADSSNGTSFVATYTGQVTLSGCNSGDADIHLYPYDVTDSARPYTDSSKSTRLSYNENVYNDNEISFYMEAGHSYTMTCRVKSGKTANHVKFYPMLRKAEITDKTFYPPHKSVEDWYWENNAKTGVHNVFPNKTNVVNGNAYLVDADGYTTTTYASDVRNWTYANCNIKFNLKKGTYRVKGFEKTASTSGYTGLHVMLSDSTQLVEATWSTLLAKGHTFTLNTDAEIGVEYKVGNGAYAFDICKIEDTYDGHTDYAMTNAELTEKVQGIINAANNSADFAAFKTAIAAL